MCGVTMQRRLRVGVLGATGSVGQRLVQRLIDHPWFELGAVAASSRSAGRCYGEAVHWLGPQPLSARVAAMPVRSVDEALDCEILFSALDSDVARRLEPELAAAGQVVVSNASALRMDAAVPLIVPEVNPQHLAMVAGRRGGCVVTNPNCATVGLVMALKPLVDRFGVAEVAVTTLQAISGAGYPGVSALDILGNVLPCIPGEEEKLESEPQKILGSLGAAGVEPLPMSISAQTTRVPVVDGHLLSVAVRLGGPASLVDVTRVMDSFRSPVADLGLPSAPARPLELLGGEMSPQPRLDVERGGGMTVSVGRLRRSPVLDYRFVALVHNTERGAAGAAVLNAELLLAMGVLN